VLQRTTLCLIAGPTRREQVKRRDRPTSRRYFIYISFVPLVNPTARHSVPAAGRRAGDDAATAGWTPGGGGGGEQVGIVGTTDLRQRRHRRRRQRRRNAAASAEQQQQQQRRRRRSWRAWWHRMPEDCDLSDVGTELMLFGAVKLAAL